MSFSQDHILPIKPYFPLKTATEKLTTNNFKFELSFNFKYMYKIELTLIERNEIITNSKIIKEFIETSYKYIEEVFGIECYIDSFKLILYSIKLVETEILITNKEIQAKFLFHNNFKQADYINLCNNYISNSVYNYISKSEVKNDVNIKGNLISFPSEIKSINDNLDAIAGIKYINKSYLNQSTSSKSKLSSVYFNPNNVYTIISKAKNVLSIINEIESTLSTQLTKDVINDNISEFIKGKEVVTKYNRYKVYQIDNINFDSNPVSTIIDYDNKKMSLFEYYKLRYSIEIKDKYQPLLIFQYNFGNYTKEMHLIPELCFLIDPLKTEDDKKAIKEFLLKQSYKDNFVNIMNFISNIIQFKQKNDNTTKILNIKNCLSLSVKPLAVYGIKLEKIYFIANKDKNGQRFTLSQESLFSSNNNLPLNQSQVYSQPPIPLLYILCSEADLPQAKLMIQVIENFKLNNEYLINKIDVMRIPENSQNIFVEWETCLKTITNPLTTGVIALIPNIQEKNLLYKFIKKYLLSINSIPSQVVLTSTLLLKKNEIRNISIKLINQLSVKLNGELWNIENMPFTNYPNMIVGVHETFLNGRVIFSISATLNSSFSRYYSDYVFIDDYNEDSTSEALVDLVNKSLDNFSTCQLILPQSIIILRDNNLPSLSNETYLKEAHALKKYLSNDRINEKIKITYITVKEKFSYVKFFSNHESKLYNPSPGKLIVDNVTNEKNEFFIISSNNKSGLNLSSYYQVIVDEDEKLINDIHDLCYKLCFMYFNYNNAINYPAPLMYAKKLSNLIGNVLSDNEEKGFVSDKMKNQVKSLYYI